LAAVYTTFGFSYIIYATFFTKYIQDEVGFSKEWAGALWHVIGWISLSCGLIWGTLSDFLGRKHALALVSFVQGSAYLIFAAWTGHTGLIFSVVLFGITAWSIPGIMASACGDEVGSRLAPAALGFVTLFFGIGQACGPALAGTISHAVGSFAPAFVIAGLTAWAGAVMSLFLKRSSLRQRPNAG
jgi:predicted MFS family arabinose efflux permease